MPPHPFLYIYSNLLYMKRLTLTICSAALLLACNNSENKSADQTSGETKVAGAADAKTEPWKVVDSATAEKNWMAYMTPGEAHTTMAKWDGEWVGDMTMWMGEGAPPMKSTTTASNKMIMGGRYHMSEHKGNFMGAPFEGMSTMGYDNAKKVYESTWIDNMGTGVMRMEGSYDSTTKTYSMKGRIICPANGQECDVRETYRIIDDNTHVMEMYGPDMKTGKEYKNMEIRFTRKK